MRSRSERGNVLLVVMLVVVLLGLLAAAAFSMIRQASEMSRVDLALRGQTLHVAESGIAEALSWFRAEAQQPVRIFAPDLYAADIGPKVPDALFSL